MDKKFITIVDDFGLKQQVELIGIVPSKRDEKVYIVYTDNDTDNEEVDLYFAILKEDKENFRIESIDSDEEFRYVQELVESEVK